MPFQLISVVECPFQSDDIRCPSVGDGGLPLLVEGETVLWRGRAGIKANSFNGKVWKEAWKAPEEAHVVLTDQRLAYSVLKMRAADRRRGRVATGQLAHLWVRQLAIFQEEGVMKRRQSVGILCQVDDTNFSFVMTTDPATTQSIVDPWARAAAAQRLALLPGLEREKIERLRDIEAAPQFEPRGKAQQLSLPGALKVGFD